MQSRRCLEVVFGNACWEEVSHLMKRKKSRVALFLDTVQTHLVYYLNLELPPLPHFIAEVEAEEADHGEGGEDGDEDPAFDMPFAEVVVHSLVPEFKLLEAVDFFGALSMSVIEVDVGEVIDFVIFFEDFFGEVYVVEEEPNHRVGVEASDLLEEVGTDHDG